MPDTVDVPLTQEEIQFLLETLEGNDQIVRHIRLKLMDALKELN